MCTIQLPTKLRYSNFQIPSVRYISCLVKNCFITVVNLTVQFAPVVSCLLLVFVARGKRIDRRVVQKGMVSISPGKWLLPDPQKGVRDELCPRMLPVFNFESVRVPSDQRTCGQGHEQGYKLPHTGRFYRVLLLGLQILGERALPAAPDAEQTTREEFGSHLCCATVSNHAQKEISHQR